MKRGSGILMHISSLPSKYGIGSMGKQAYEFVDFLYETGQKYWQILPIGPTSYGDSPYQSFSTFAGNPYFIDLDTLAESGALKESEYATLNWGGNAEKVDYEAIFENRFKVLKLAFKREKITKKKEIEKFRYYNSYWVENYAMYMALKFKYDLVSYQEWPEDIKLRKPQAVVNTYEELSEEIDFWVYVQYLFNSQWTALKIYANDKGIKIIGDIPIYVAEDSADAWAHNEILMLDEDRTPIKVAGCPPDYYAPLGQLWGNPIYDWKYLKSSGYEWWEQRIKAALKMYDIVRIDHFRAFDAFYTIDYGRKDAVIGEWLKGPGTDFFEVLRNRLGKDPAIIAEDLGTITDDVRALLKFSGFPGMKVMQFGFDPVSDSEYLPHNFVKNSVAYIGTHDNDTLIGWYEQESENVKRFINKYLRLSEKEGLTWGFINSLLASVSDIAIISMQDLLGLGSEARMNIPSTLGGNWQWRMKSMDCLTDDLKNRLKGSTSVYKR